VLLIIWSIYGRDSKIMEESLLIAIIRTLSGIGRGVYIDFYNLVSMCVTGCYWGYGRIIIWFTFILVLCSIMI